MIALRYHDATKHHFNRFARSAGRLDWATQPDPFRRYAGAPLIELPREAVAPDVPYDALFGRGVAAAPFGERELGEFLRCSMGLSAWKQFGQSRWALRVNPSSGNLHPTEAYVIVDGRVCHYAPREHALEQRATLDAAAWGSFTRGHPGFLVALTSIYWREAWKYGERAFRYCQHDTGHAIGALRLAAALLGWKLTLLPHWSDADLASVLGIQTTPGDAEPEAPECIAIVTPGDPSAWLAGDPAALVDAAKRATWAGTPNLLSPSRVEWPIIDEVHAATTKVTKDIEGHEVSITDRGVLRPRRDLRARDIILQRRSAVAFDARSTLPRDAFLRMLRRVNPGAPPWDAINWPPHVHLALFVHRVDGLAPGVYAWLRDPAVLDEWRAAMRSEFLWEHIADSLHLLLPFDMRFPANRVSCDQDIAGDGFFSLGMIARTEPSLHERGESFYRRLFWESGVIGQVLYLEAEAAGGRATGIGCFYDDPVHDMLGLTGHTWQSLYHFSMGVPVDDERLTTAPGYEWES